MPGLGDPSCGWIGLVVAGSGQGKGCLVGNNNNEATAAVLVFLESAQCGPGIYLHHCIVSSPKPIEEDAVMILV